MTIRRAAPEELESVRNFYYRMIDQMQGFPYRPKWQKEIYPSRDYLRSSLDAGSLYICEEDGAILSAMILNHHTADGYETARWNVQALAHEITVVHTLGVAVDRMGQGIGKRMMEFAIDHARGTAQRALRLDALVGNEPARRLYLAMGFQHTGQMRLFYEDTGLCEFDLYEYVIA